MNKKVFEMFLTEDIDEILDEALPKDLATAYNNSELGPLKRNAGYTTGAIDWENTTYTPISPEEGKRVWKDNPTSLILIITDNGGKDRAVKFRADGKVDIDAIYGNYRFNLPKDKAYIKRDGTKVTDVFKAKINHLLSIAKKIYVTDEGSVHRDTSVLKDRSSNPESPNYGGIDKVGLSRKYIDKNRESVNLLDKLDYWKKHYTFTDIPLIKDSGERYIYNDDNTVTFTGQYGGTGDESYWWEKFIKYFKNWSAYDSDTFNIWCAYLLAKQKGNRSYRNPTADELGASDLWRKDLAAELRYLDLTRVLQEPKEKVKQSLKDAKNLESRLEGVKQNKDRFTSPEARKDREGDINYYISRYKSRLLDIINELEKYESRLDNLDASDTQKIKEYDDEIDRLVKEIDSAKKAYNDIMANGAFTNSIMGRKVPESLQEEKSLDELVDILVNRKSESLNELAEDLTDEDKVTSLAEYLDVDPSEITEIDQDYYDTPEGEYIVVNKDEAYDRAASEIRMTFDDLGLQAFTPNFQKYIIDYCISDSAIQEFIDEEIGYFETQEDDSEQLEYLKSLTTRDDKLNYIKEIFGDMSDFVKKDNIDMDKVIEEAIKEDGVAHFIAYYDGEENELGHGYYAYRVN